MARLDCDCERRDGVSLVELYLTSDVTEDVRVEIAHDGPVWPPRRQGVPESGWDDAGWTGTVGPDDPVVLGYATPAETGDEPAGVADSEPSTADAEPSDPTPRELVRTLGDASPPRDAVPGPTESVAPESTDREVETADHDGVPSFEATADRIERAERLASVSTVDEATAAVREAGGIDAVRALAEQLAADRTRLAIHAERSGRLAERVAAVEIPVETLERVT